MICPGSKRLVSVLVAGVLLAGPLWSSAQGGDRDRDKNSRARERRVLQLKYDLVREEIAMIATAIEEYSIDYTVYPSTEGELAGTVSLAKSLVPDYLDVVPLRDPFGGYYQYWSNGRGYALISPGHHGVLDLDYGSLLENPSGETWASVCRGGIGSAEGVDVVWVNGAGCHWPVRREGG